MKFKPVPEPPADLETVVRTARAVPTQAEAVDDCCAHLLAETRLTDRDAAATWLVFLRALEVVTEEPAGYRRLEADPTVDPAAWRRSFRERIYGAEAVLETLADSDDPLSAAAVADAVRRDSSARARAGRTDDREGRIERLLEWAVLLGVADRSPEGYRYVTTAE
ncbi:hypothetical protein [Halopiger goleimassiliensis]|uniref:hypothetical protein n=1 Tax=Halopiger goleimassiliensis TaxID=1293048 RepID=UPI000677BFB1|nr:hypothetical protein [Halopiger goleimassiliensis]